MQDGSVGCISAHVILSIKGWAEDVIGVTGSSIEGSVRFWSGNKIGDTYGGKWSLEMLANPSTAVSVLGHVRFAGKFEGCRGI